MSEVNLNDQVEETIDDATVITVPIDDTLSNSGEAADAKAVGDALALKADLSQVTGISVNGENPDEQGAILLDASEIPMSEDVGADSVAEAISAVGSRTADEIYMSEGESVPTIADAIDALDESVVKITEQTLSADEMGQARTNIGAAAQDDVTQIASTISRIHAIYSLVTATTATSDTTRVINTYGSRKFSDYSRLVFVLYESATSKVPIRQTMFLPSSHWTTGASIQLIQNHGTSLGIVSGVQIHYNSDTSVRAYTIGAGSLAGFEILGYPAE